MTWKHGKASTILGEKMSLNDEIKPVINGHEKEGGKLPPPSDHIVDTQDWCELEALRETLREHMAEIHRLRAALAEGAMQRLTDVQQEMEQCPFGYFKAEPFGWTDCAETDEGARPLYEHPPRREWVGLTDDEIWEISQNNANECEYVRAIEVKLKEKNL